MVTVFALNRSVADAVPLRVDLKSDRRYDLAQASRLHDDDPYAGNTAENPNRVRPYDIDDVKLDDDALESVLPPLSWDVYRLTPTH